MVKLVSVDVMGPLSQDVSTACLPWQLSDELEYDKSISLVSLADLAYNSIDH